MVQNVAVSVGVRTPVALLDGTRDVRESDTSVVQGSPRRDGSVYRTRLNLHVTGALETTPA